MVYLRSISNYSVEPNYTNDHNDKYPCPANYDSQKYTWRETSLSRDLYGMYQGYAKSSRVVQAWMDSPGHRANILRSEFTRGAIAFYELNGQEYWCQLFGK